MTKSGYLKNANKFCSVVLFKSKGIKVMSELVSIIIPSFNTGKFIGETIESVLNQSYKKLYFYILIATSFK